MAISSRAAVVVCSYVVLMSAVGALGTRRAGFFNSTKMLDNYRQYTAGVVIFGDSTVDVGNNNHLVTVVKSNFKPYGRSFQGGKSTGRFCDGKISSDRITEIIGYPYGLPYLSPEAHGPAILTGINFASSASGWYDLTARNFNVKGLTDQFEWYKNWKAEVLSLVGQEKGNHIISTSLYIVSTGANDWVNNYYLNPALMKKYNPDEYTTLLIGFARGYIQELYNLGGRNIAVLGLPPLGCLPSQITLHGKGSQDCVEDFNTVSVKFNDLLKNLIINELKPKFSGARLLYIDIYTILYSMRTNPSAYGITETRNGCCGTGVLETAILCNQASIGTCQDANTYLWWDSFHPTEYAYNILAADLFDQAEEVLVGPAQP